MLIGIKMKNFITELSRSDRLKITSTLAKLTLTLAFKSIQSLLLNHCIHES